MNHLLNKIFLVTQTFYLMDTVVCVDNHVFSSGENLHPPICTFEWRNKTNWLPGRVRNSILLAKETSVKPDALLDCSVKEHICIKKKYPIYEMLTSCSDDSKLISADIASCSDLSKLILADIASCPRIKQRVNHNDNV